MQIVEHILDWASANRPSALVTVIHTSGSTPRHRGAMMLVDADGTIYSTIGGGQVEFEVIQCAQEIALGQREATKVTHHLVRDLAMCCGGSMTFWIEALLPLKKQFESVKQRLELRQEVVLQTHFDTHKKVILENEKSAIVRGDHFVQKFLPDPRAIILGAGHVAQALGPLAHQCGFQVILCDDNQTGELDILKEWVFDSVPSFEVGDIKRTLSNIGKYDFILIMTRNHGVDERALASLLPDIDHFAYLGLIGSMGKLGRFRKRLEQKGLTVGWSKLHCPIGVDVGAETPKEIAVSVMAELIHTKNRIIATK